MTHFHFVHPWFNHLHFAHLNFNLLPIRYTPHPQMLEKHNFIKNQNITLIKNTNYWIFSSRSIETRKSLVLSWGFDFFDHAFMWGWGSDFGLSLSSQNKKIHTKLNENKIKKCHYVKKVKSCLRTSKMQKLQKLFSKRQCNYRHTITNSLQHMNVFPTTQTNE